MTADFRCANAISCRRRFETHASLLLQQISEMSCQICLQFFCVSFGLRILLWKPNCWQKSNLDKTCASTWAPQVTGRDQRLSQPVAQQPLVSAQSGVQDRPLRQSDSKTSCLITVPFITWCRRASRRGHRFTNATLAKSQNARIAKN